MGTRLFLKQWHFFIDLLLQPINTVCVPCSSASRSRVGLLSSPFLLLQVMSSLNLLINAEEIDLLLNAVCLLNMHCMGLLYLC
jgi:hypothetical protein